MEGDGLTMDSVAKMSTYDLRKEVEHRGVLEDVNPVNHNTLLRRLVQVRHIVEFRAAPVHRTLPYSRSFGFTGTV